MLRRDPRIIHTLAPGLAPRLSKVAIMYAKPTANGFDRRSRSGMADTYAKGA